MREPKPDGKFGAPVQVHEAEPHRYKLRKDGKAVEYSVCCDCGLVHLEEFTPRKGYIRVRVWRDEDRTEEQRRSGQYPLSKRRAKRA